MLFPSIFNTFCKEHDIQHAIIHGLNVNKLNKNEVYIIFPDNELISSLKHIKEKGWELGKDIGIISYDDTPMKEILFGGFISR